MTSIYTLLFIVPVTYFVMQEYLRALLKRAPHLYAWEKDYRMRGNLWRGPFLGFNFSEIIPRKAKVLELGCGDGKTLFMLVSAGFKVTGIDISPSAISLARKKVGGRKAKLVVGDVCNLPFAANSFDAIVAVHVFDHLTSAERKKAATECSRVLKKNSLLLFQGFDSKDFRFGQGKKIELRTFRRANNIWYHYFTSAEVKKLFSKFELIELQEHCRGRKLGGKNVERCVIKLIARKV